MSDIKLHSKKTWVKEDTALKNGWAKEGERMMGAHKLPSGRWCYVYISKNYWSK